MFLTLAYLATGLGMGYFLPNAVTRWIKKAPLGTTIFHLSVLSSMAIGMVAPYYLRPSISEIAATRHGLLYLAMYVLGIGLRLGLNKTWRLLFK